MRRTYNGCLAFRGPNGLEGRCFLQVYEAAGALPVVLATETSENPGQSVTNAAEAIATEVWRALLPHAREGFRLFEIYRRPRADGRIEECFDEVDLRLTGPNQLEAADWRSSSRAAVEALIGVRFAVPVKSSY
ncbi:MAG TPA: hypothetical protein VNL71_04600 [Chloroflexota bacterium]|nr:hypothetical protein [Chloroflexota bacterium]